MQPIICYVGAFKGGLLKLIRRLKENNHGSTCNEA